VVTCFTSYQSTAPCCATTALPVQISFCRLFEIVYNELREKRLTLLHEFEVLRMDLVFILSLFVSELNVQRHLVGLINNVAMAGRHLSDVEIHNTRDWRQVFLGCDGHVIRGVGLTWIGPKDNYV